ncbi:uncharacterized protein LOC126694706 isoform X1 [Quercus robur]|uniref:uncharacterized protein LOC126694706 isoform X1 n=1 Tax=Quercus robur TaxID=38942 RepID=UPI0021611B6D|nr:uncharacterized protein LOC126694706 isoform X1 [Quercus robur]
MWRDPGTPADSYYQVRPECTDVPKTRFKIKAGKTLSVRKWQAAFTPEGYLDISKTLSRIHRGRHLRQFFFWDFVHFSMDSSTWVFFCSFFGFESKEIALSFRAFGNVETLELLLILSTRSALSALVFQRPASKSRFRCGVD